MTRTPDSERIIGKHANCGGNVVYQIRHNGNIGKRVCDKCIMSSHDRWTDATGVVQRPLSPDTEEEEKGREARRSNQGT